MPMYQPSVSGDGVAPDVADFAALLAVPSPVAGERRRTIAPAILGGISHLQWKKETSAWRLAMSQDLLVDFSPATGVAGTSEQILRQWLLPPGLLLSLRWVRIWFVVAKSGTTDAVANARIRLGSAGTTADAVIASSANPNASNRQAGFANVGFAASAAQWRAAFTGGNAGWGDGYSTTVSYPANATIDSASGALYLSLSIQMAGSTDTPSIPHVVITGG